MANANSRQGDGHQRARSMFQLRKGAVNGGARQPMMAEPAVASSRGEPNDDADVIQQSRDDPDRFAVIFDRHVDEVHRYVSRRLGEAVAEDVVGETFLLAFRQRDRFEPRRRDARPWLYGIATNLIHRHRRGEVRKYRAMQRLGVAPAEENHADRVVGTVSTESARQQLGKALASLSPGTKPTDQHAGGALEPPPARPAAQRSYS